MKRIRLTMVERILMKLHWALFELSDKLSGMVLKKYNENGFYNTWSWNVKKFNGEIVLMREEES